MKNNYIIDTNKIQEAQNALNKVEYKINNVEKVLKVKQDYESNYAYEDLQSDLCSTLKDNINDFIFINQYNKREYNNIFNSIELNDIDYKRIGLNKKEIEKLEYCDIDFYDNKINILLYNENYVSQKEVEKIENKINENVYIFNVEARGYSQSDYEMYTFYCYKDIKNNVIENLKDIKYLFTVTSFELSFINREEREYKNGDINIIDNEIKRYNLTSYDGDFNDEEYKDYKIEYKV